MLPKHGKINCRECFTITPSNIAIPHPEWRMINDPGAWGSENPDFLVLGFSKGATQVGFYNQGRFEDTAFAGMRQRLTQGLRALGILSAEETSEQKISNPDSNIAFGSLIRCSVSRKANASTQGYSCSGPLIVKSFSEIPQVIHTCSERYLTKLPNSLKLIIFLGNTDSYVKNCQKLIRKLYPDFFEIINPMAVKTDKRIWIHIAHPSGLNGHFNTWLNSNQGSGIKRIQARQAIEQVINRNAKQHQEGSSDLDNPL